MTLYMTAARIDEKGNASGGKSGDQTGKEVIVQTYGNYSRGWDGVLRLQQGKLTKAEYQRALNRLMHCAYLFAENDRIGYDQHERSTLYDAMSKRGWKMRYASHIGNCECDCSMLMGVVANCALKPIKAIQGTVPKSVYTGNMREIFTGLKGKTKWTWIDSGLNFTNGNGLKRGDILLNEGHHTALFMGNAKQGQYYC